MCEDDIYKKRKQEEICLQSLEVWHNEKKQYIYLTAGFDIV